MPSSPVIYTDSHGRRVVGIGSKCGSYFLLDADSLQILARRQLLPYANGQPIYDIDNSGGDYGVFGTAAVDAALGRLFIPMGGSVDNSSPPFLRAVDWETL